MSDRISSSARLVVLLGDPVSHSLSPIFQNAAFRVANVDGVYVALRCGAEDFRGLLVGIARGGGAGNVTVPHKAAAADCVQEPTDAVVWTGACNTYWLENDRIHGDNTDVAGFTRAVESLLGRSPGGARVLLVGAGGAARAAAVALIHSQVDEIVIVNRSPDRSEALCARLASDGSRLVPLTMHAIAGQSFDLAVNATSLGLRADDPLPLSLEGGPRFAAALDLVYSPGRTPWIRALREREVVADDGLEMLIQQGAASFERWWGFPPSLAAMRASLAPR